MKHSKLLLAIPALVLAISGIGAPKHDRLRRPGSITTIYFYRSGSYNVGASGATTELLFQQTSNSYPASTGINGYVLYYFNSSTLSYQPLYWAL